MTFLFSPRFQAIDANGNPQSGAVLYFYEAGTTTAVTVYKDYAKAESHGTSVTADAGGLFDAIWVDTDPYKFILKTSGGTTIATVDNVYGPALATSGIFTTPWIEDTTGDNYYKVAVSELAAHRTITLPLLGADDTFVFANFTQTLKNKALEDSTTAIVDNSDNTKKIAFQASGITTGTTRTITMPDADVTLMPEATAAQYRANTADKALSTDVVFSAGAVVALTDAATIALDMSDGFNFSVTLGGNRTLGNPTNVKVPQSGFIVITQDGTGSRTLAYGTDWEFASASAPTLSTAAGAKDILWYQVLATGSVFASLTKAVA